VDGRVSPAMTKDKVSLFRGERRAVLLDEAP
jgi:hypothetical protein